MSNSRHRDPPLTVRPPAALKTAAQEELTSRNHETKAFVVACLKALVADPDGFLAHLAEHWPAETPRGRPRKTAAPQPTEPPPARSQAKAHAKKAATPRGDNEDVPFALDIPDEPPPD